MDWANRRLTESQGIQLPLIAGEQQQDLDRLNLDTRRRLQPSGPLESETVDRIVSLTWRLRRLERIEAEALSPDTSTSFGRMLAKQNEGNGVGSLTTAAYAASADMLAKITRQQSELQRMLGRANKDLADLQAARGKR